jgi:hypothetical protein
MWNTIKALVAGIVVGAGAIVLAILRKLYSNDPSLPVEEQPFPSLNYDPLTKTEIDKILDKEPHYEENITLDPLATTLYGEPREPDLGD